MAGACAVVGEHDNIFCIMKGLLYVFLLADRQREFSGRSLLEGYLHNDDHGGRRVRRRAPRNGHDALIMWRFSFEKRKNALAAVEM